jgi:DNA polymerase-3 subunit delta'
MFTRIKGQDKVIDLLKVALEQDRIAQSYLFHGPDGVGKFTTALYFAMSLNCLSLKEKRPCGVCPSCSKFLNFTHPDFIYVFPTVNLDLSKDGEIRSNKALDEYRAYIDNKINTPWKSFFFSAKTEIRIASIRLIEHRISLTPNEGNYKVYIIEDADQMNINTANAFLKTLEEPPVDTVIILTSSKPESLLPTITSRCQRLNFKAVPRRIIENELIESSLSDPIEARTYARIANGNMEKALRLAEEGKIASRQETIELLGLIINKDDLKFLSFADRFRFTRNRNILADVISHLSIWLSDVVYHGKIDDDIVNSDHMDLLSDLKSAGDNLDENASDLLMYLENMQLKLTGNVNPYLIIMGIYNRFKEVFNRTTRK